MTHLLASYPAAITDFYGCGTPCIYKTGPAWPVAQGPQSQKIKRAARPIYNHDIAPIWLETAWKIVSSLDSLQVDWNTVDPLAYANAGQAGLICDFVIIVSVRPLSLVYGTAVAAANAVNKILEQAGFPLIQVAFIESVYRRQGKLMRFDPTYDLHGIPGLRKPFTPTLGLAIAPQRSPYYEGTGGLLFRLNTDKSDKRTVLLTCAHVARPPPLPQFKNEEYTRKSDSQPREDIILLGSGSFNDSVVAIMKFIGDESKAIASWETPLGRIPEPVEGEAMGITTKRKELTDLIAASKNKIKVANELHSYVTKNYTTTDSRILGFVLHFAKIEVGSDGFMYDWALIQVDDDKLEDFKGNMLFVGGNKTAVDWENFMFAQTHDRRDLHVPENFLLPLQDYVREAEFRDPQNYDIYNVKTLLAVKNGRTTGTSFGRVNGLESITRHYPEYGVEARAVEIIVCNYDTKTAENHRFSHEGDSGSIVVGRDGRIIGLLSAGAGPTNKTDKTYITPFYALKKEIEKKYPNACLLPADACI